MYYWEWRQLDKALRAVGVILIVPPVYTVLCGRVFYPAAIMEAASRDILWNLPLPYFLVHAIILTVGMACLILGVIIELVKG